MMARSLNLSKAYRTFLRLLTNRIVSYSVIAGLVASSFGVGQLYESNKGDKEMNSKCLEWMKDVESFNKEIFELRKENVELLNEIAALKQKNVEYENRK